VTEASVVDRNIDEDAASVAASTESVFADVSVAEARSLLGVALPPLLDVGAAVTLVLVSGRTEDEVNMSSIYAT